MCECEYCGKVQGKVLGIYIVERKNMPHSIQRIVCLECVNGLIEDGQTILPPSSENLADCIRVEW